MADLVQAPVVMTGEGWADYGLIDSGDGRKLERYGPHRFIRPDAQALWRPRLERWASDGEFVPGSDEDGGGRWQFARPVSQEGWPLSRGDLKFTAQCTPFRHLGFFPDMAPVWDWMGEQLAGRGEASTLNLFGYTGVGTLALSRFGPVTHVDASKKSVAQARVNAALSGMDERPIRWIVDDAAKFTAREVRRGKRYDGIILDPPKFGRGPEGEVWRLEEHLAALVEDCRRLLDDNSRFLFLTVYAVRLSSLALAGLLDAVFADLPGTIEHGDLAMREEGPLGRLLPTAIFARWRNPGKAPVMADSLILEVADFDTDVLTGIYSEETGRPQPLRITIQARLKVAELYLPDTPLKASKNYMDLKFAASDALPPGVHFKLIELVADHICETLFVQDDRVEAVTVKIVKLAIAENGEKIGITLTRGAALMACLRIAGLPGEALAAAAQFHAEVLPKARAALAAQPSHLALIFPPADHTHRAWRLAAVQALAREYAPVRVNGLVSDSEAAIAAARDYLATAEGVTGQLLQLDDTGAGKVVSSPA